MTLFARCVRHLVLMLAALFLLWLCGYLVFACWVAGMKPQSPEAPTDAVIVLTGGAGRVNAGLELLSQGTTSQLYISGVNRSVSLNDILSHWHSNIEKKSAAACCIVLDHQAQNTAQNATETAEWVKREKIGSIRLVTSNYHMPRAWLEFRAALPDVALYPYPVMSVRADIESGKFWFLTFSEYHKALLTLIRTRFQAISRPGGDSAKASPVSP